MKMRPVLATGFAAAITFAAVAPVHAAPVMTSTAVLKDAAPTATQVRWRGGGAIAGGIIAGLAAGAIAGAVSAPYYGYGGPYYDYGPAPGPVYVEPSPYYPQIYYYGGGHDPAGCGPGSSVC
jgi:hypothetical protein